MEMHKDRNKIGMKIYVPDKICQNQADIESVTKAFVILGNYERKI